MSTEAVSFPFYRLSPEALKGTGEWQYARVGDNESIPEPLGGCIESWDYQVDLEFLRTLSVDVPALLRDCGLEPGTVVRILVLVSTAGQRIRRRVCSVDLTCDADSGKQECELVFGLEGAALQGDIRVDTEIGVLDAVPGNPEDPFVPVSKGSRLWSDSVTTALEGSLSRFPMSSVSFRNAFGNIGDAAWMLHWSPDMVDSNVSAAMRLYLNKDSDLFDEIVAGETSLYRVVETDVLRQILVTFLADDDFDISPDSWAQYSLGSFAAQWLSNIFGDAAADQLRSRARSEPGWVDARIQSFMRSGIGN